jgi:hypothetical protein
MENCAEPRGQQWNMNRHQKDATVAVVAGVIVEFVIAVANYSVSAQPARVQTLIRLNAIQSIGGAIAEHLYPRLGYAAALVAGCAVQAGIFGVFILGIIGLYRAIRVQSNSR